MVYDVCFLIGCFNFIFYILLLLNYVIIYKKLPNFFYVFSQICYNYVAAFPLYYGSGGGVKMSLVVFILSVLASIVAYYICKWVDRHLL